MSSGLTIESDLQQVESEWDGLAERVGASPFHRPGWFSAWLSAFGEGRLEVAALRTDGSLAAVLPLRGNRRRLRSPTNWHTPVFGPVATSPDAERELLERLFSLDVRSVGLSLLDSSDGTEQRVAEAARRAGRQVVRRVLASAPYIPLEGDWETYERGLSKNRRRGIRRRMRALEQEGPVSFHVERGEARLEELLEDALRVEGSGWKTERGTAIVSRPETRRFYVELARWAAGRGWLRLAFLRLDGRPLAMDFAIEHGGSWYSLKSGYEPELRSYAPGVLLLHAELRHAYEAGLERFELLGQTDEFKRDWTDRTVELGWVGAFAPSPGGHVLATAVRGRERVRPLARRLRKLVSR